jgi:ankyrin repeat protein
MLSNTQWRNWLQDISFVDQLIDILFNKYHTVVSVNTYQKIINYLGPEITSEWKNLYDNLSIFNKKTVNRPVWMGYLIAPFFEKSNYINRLIKDNIAFNINMMDVFGKTPLIYAVLNNNVKLTKYLLNNGANPNHIDNDFMKAWEYANLINDDKIKSFFVYDQEEWASSVRAMCKIIFSTTEQREEVQNAILSEGLAAYAMALFNISEENNTNDFSEFVYQIIREYHDKLLIVIFQAMNKENVLDGPFLSNILVSDNTILRARYEKIKLLVDLGANVNKQDDNGNTSLYKAVFYDKKELITYLLLQGADPTIENNLGQTVFTFIVKNRNLNRNKKIELIDTVLRRGKGRPTRKSLREAQKYYFWIKNDFTSFIDIFR